MELQKLKKSEISEFDASHLREVERDIRAELARIRLDVLSDSKQHIGKVRNLKKNLARVLTYRHALTLNPAQQQVSG